MKGFFRSNTFKVLLTVVTVLFGVTMLSVTTGSSSFSGFITDMFAPMHISYSTIENSDTKLYDGYTQKELKEICTELTEENDRLRNQLTDYYNMKEENELLRDLLEIKKEYKNLELTGASVIGRDPVSAKEKFTINVGKIDGIQKGDPVIAASGAVGVVGEVYDYSAEIITLYGGNVKVGVKINEATESGVVTGGRDISKVNYLVLDYLKADSGVRAGMIATTSGSGVNFPPDIPVGTIMDVRASERDSSRTALIKSFVDVEKVERVFIVTNYRAAYAENTVEGGEAAE